MANDFLKELEKLTESVNTPGRVASLDEKKELPPAFLKNIKGKDGKAKGDEEDDDNGKDTGDDKEKNGNGKNGNGKGKGKLPPWLQKGDKKKNGNGDKKKESIGEHYSNLPAEERRVALKMIQKGYAYAVQFTNPDGTPFGEPLYFRASADVGRFMRDYPELTMAWSNSLLQESVGKSVQKRTLTITEAAKAIKLKLSCIIAGGDMDEDKNTAIKRGEIDGMDPEAVSQWESDYWDAVASVLWAGWKVSGTEVVDNLVGQDYQEGDYSNVFIGEINRGSDKYNLIMDRLEMDGYDTEIEQLGMDDVVKAAGNDLKPEFKHLAASVYVYLYPEPEIKAEFEYWETMRDLQDQFDNVDLDISAFQMGVEGKPVHTGQLVYAVERGIMEELDNVLGGIDVKLVSGIKATVKLPSAGKPGSRADFDVTVEVYVNGDKVVADGEGKVYADWGLEKSYVLIDSARIRFKSFLDFQLESKVRGNPAYMTLDEKRRVARRK